MISSCLYLFYCIANDTTRLVSIEIYRWLEDPIFIILRLLVDRIWPLYEVSNPFLDDQEIRQRQIRTQDGITEDEEKTSEKLCHLVLF